MSHQFIPKNYNYPLQTLLQNVFLKPEENTDYWPVEFNDSSPLSTGSSSVFQKIAKKSFLLIESTHFFLLLVCSFLLPIGIEKNLLHTKLQKISSHPGLCCLDSQLKKSCRYHWLLPSKTNFFSFPRPEGTLPVWEKNRVTYPIAIGAFKHEYSNSMKTVYILLKPWLPKLWLWS